MAVLWQCGDEVLWRETWRDRTWFAMRVRVVEDTEEELALYVAEGTRFGVSARNWPFDGAHPWAGRSWEGHGTLVVHRPGDSHAVWHFWEELERRFAGWYVNLQDPFRRDGFAFDTVDHELDLWIEPNGTWQWKDEEKLQDWVERGRFTPDEAVTIRAEGERVLAEWPFPTGWETWAPDPSWPIPELPPGWDTSP